MTAKNPTTQTPRWDVFELSFLTTQHHSNPFVEVALALTFRFGTQSWSLDGFYDGTENGKEQFRARFAPMHEGTWHWETRSNCADLDGLHGSFLCTPPLTRGPLALNPQFPNWFFRADGTPEWVVNDGWYPHPLFGDRLDFEELEFGSPQEEDILSYLRLIGKYGVNMTIEVDQLYARQGYATDPSFNWPWASSPDNPQKIDRERFNLDYYARMERTLRCAQEQGIFYWVELLFDNSVFRPREWGFHPLNVCNGGWLSANAQGTCWPDITDLENAEHVRYISRYLSYTVARFSAFWNVCWALGAESGNLTAQHQGRIARWYNHWGRFVSLHDPHGRLQSIGDTGEGAGLVQSAQNQAVMTQEHTSMEDGPAFCDAIRSFGLRFWPYGRPTFIGEQDRHNCGHFDMERRGYWTAFASGYFMGRVDRHFRPSQDGASYEGILFCEGGTPPIYPDLLRMRRFIESSGIRFWRMAPAPDALSKASAGVSCLAEAGVEYLVYFAFGGGATLNLPESLCRWYNPRDGLYREEIRIEAGSTVWTAPDGEDWVLHIRHA